MADVQVSSNIILKLPFFSGLNGEEKAELLKAATFKHIQRGEILFLHGSPLTNLYWICDGTVQMFRSTPDGHELTSSINIVGDLLFDPDALQHKQNHTMNARAIQDSTFLTLSLVWFDEHIKSYEGLQDSFFNLLAQRAQEAVIETEHQAVMNATQLVACFLQKLCVSHDLPPRGFDIPYTKSIIASRLGMKLESFSRTLPKLKALGITVSGKYVSFDNIEAAQQHSCHSCSAIYECPAHRIMKELAVSAVNAVIPA